MKSKIYSENVGPQKDLKYFLYQAVSVGLSLYFYSCDNYCVLQGLN